MPPALKFDLIMKCSVGVSDFCNGISKLSLVACQVTKARAAVLHLPHGPVELPIFMPVATQASLKGLTPEQLEATGCRLCLNNTYHLYAASAFLLCTTSILEANGYRGLRPGQATLDAIGGAHRLQSWNHNLLTGTYQSLRNAAFLADYEYTR